MTAQLWPTGLVLRHLLPPPPDDDSVAMADWISPTSSPVADKSSRQWCLVLRLLQPHCSVLMDLEIEDVRTLILSDQPPVLQQTQFSRLQRLKFFPDEMNAVTQEQLFRMLCNIDKLTEACLGWCQLTDASLEALVASGTFAHLREFELNEVEYISGVGLRSLVAADSDLAALTIFGCDFVTRADIEQLREQVAQQNLDLVIRYFEL
ncbi:hypothetical protein HPB51_005702 [Rhipicephalus microplus]|uniref:Uncharacterized protein n=1 Tax=Rhipicephalus microplus TaxID=6941 RepID=A0A9J6ELS8_RHIMP|nr:hypothetical protein HPB51_005702 [Rhipicephalus microplus]